MYQKGLLGEFMSLFTKTTILFFVVIGSFFAVEAIASQNEKNNQEPYIEKEHFHKPPKNVKKKIKFVPTATPSTSEVYKIAALEQKRWGGPSLINRIYCESTLNWSVTNGQYRGLLQFGPIWDSMWPGTPRKVIIKSNKTIEKKVYRYRKWSHIDKWIKKPSGSIRQKVNIVRVGKLPKYPDPYHGWAAIRVGQRAVSGDGPTTSWACGL